MTTLDKLTCKTGINRKLVCNLLFFFIQCESRVFVAHYGRYVLNLPIADNYGHSLKIIHFLFLTYIRMGRDRLKLWRAHVK